jgi:hypothetical protein
MMSRISIKLLGGGQDVIIKGDGWYMLSLEQSGLYRYSSIGRSGVDYDRKHEAKLRIVGVDVDGF